MVYQTQNFDGVFAEVRRNTDDSCGVTAHIRQQVSAHLPYERRHPVVMLRTDYSGGPARIGL